MLRYELVNPSDRYEMTAATHEAAAIACVLLGMGNYGLRPLGNTPEPGMPLFVFGGHEEWFTKTFGRDLDAVLSGMDCAAVADALQSVADSLPSTRRTSLNNIGKRAEAAAASLRARPTALHAERSE